jgi:signal transduction histidine kinase
VKEIIELHGGKADVKSDFGVGTTVTLWVPAAPAPAA